MEELPTIRQLSTLLQRLEANINPSGISPNQSVSLAGNHELAVKCEPTLDLIVSNRRCLDFSHSYEPSMPVPGGSLE